MLKSNELKVGFLGLLAFLILYFGFNFLKGNDIFSSSKTYFVRYSNVDGLMPANPVMVNGVEVGKVKKVSLVPEKGNEILVELRINKSLLIPDQSLAILSDGALLGGKIIRLELMGNGALPEGSTIQAVNEKGLTSLLKERALPLISNADSLLISFRKISNKFENTGTYLDGLLKNSNKTITNINGSVSDLVGENKANLAQITGNMKALSISLVETEKQIKPLLVKFNTVADSLQAIRLGETLNQANKAVESLKNIVVKLEKGQGTAGKLLNNDSLYVGLNKTLLDLDKLLLDFRLQPKRYVNLSIFGKKYPGPISDK